MALKPVAVVLSHISQWQEFKQERPLGWIRDNRHMLRDPRGVLHIPVRISSDIQMIRAWEFSSFVDLSGEFWDARRYHFRQTLLSRIRP